MSEKRAAVEEVFRRVDETLATARHGYDDLIAIDKSRRFSGLRNLIVFGRSVTFVLQNLRSVINGEFDNWYELKKMEMVANPLFRYFVRARNEIEKQGKLSVSNSTYINSFSRKDISRFGPAPAGATSFFIGDALGGSGWLVRRPDGSSAKYYVELPFDIGETRQHFANFLPEEAPELGERTIEDLSADYLRCLGDIVEQAKTQFLTLD